MRSISIRSPSVACARQERVFNVALEHLPQLREARLERARVRRALGATDEAVVDVMNGSDNEVAALRLIATWYGEDGRTPAQLATWRKILARVEALSDLVLIKEARLMVRALVIVVGPADPAAAPSDDRPLRRTFSVLARRGG